MEILILVVLGLIVGLALGTFGAGGSVIAVPVLVFVVGQTAAEATTTSLVVVAAAAATGLVAHRSSGHVRWRLGLSFAALAAGGAAAGSVASGRVDGEVLLAGFALVMAAAAARMLLSPTEDQCPAEADPGGHTDLEVRPGDDGPDTPERSAVTVAERTRATDQSVLSVRVVMAATATGLLTGLFGVGGGFVIVPVLVIVLGLTMAEATATSLLVITISAAISLVARGTGAGLDLAIAVPFALAAMAGSVAGTRLAGHLSGRRASQAFAVLLALFAAYTLTSAVIGLVS